jgi:hypothetical protein
MTYIASMGRRERFIYSLRKGGPNHKEGGIFLQTFDQIHTRVLSGFILEIGSQDHPGKQGRITP